jgi:membrane fusion protein, copper/silver efflux system
MTSKEKGLLFAGLLLGAVVVTAVFAGRSYIPWRKTAPSADAALPAPVAVEADSSLDEAAGSSAAPAVELNEQEQKAIGVETVEVKRQSIRKEITAAGKVAEPETGLAMISARISGRIETLLIKVTGQAVSRGQPVALIYSPEIFTAGEEYRLALENRQRLSSSKEPQAISDADELVRASRRRLELRSLTPQQIEEIESSTGNAIYITTYAPVSGIVTKRNVAEGQYVKEGDALFEVTDLSAVWVEAQIFESDIPFIRMGQRAKITAAALAGKSTQGVVSFLQPSVDVQTRTMSARIQVANPEMRLRPGMFVQAFFDAPLSGDIVAVPRSAVIDAGKEKVVYVAKENGLFEKRVVETAAAGDDYLAVTKGVKAGERVVTHGNFLIDSQSRLAGNMTGLFGGAKSFATDAEQPASNYKLTFRPDSASPKVGSEETFHVSVNDPAGKPVSDAQVQASIVMPAMPAMGMPEMRSSVSVTWNGSDYTGKGTLGMAGSWNVTVEARRGGQVIGVYRTRLEVK